MESQDSCEGTFETVCSEFDMSSRHPSCNFSPNFQVEHVTFCKVHKATFRLPEAGGGVQDLQCKNILFWFVLPKLLCNIFHVKGQQGMHLSKACNQEIQGVVKVQHAHVEEMLGSERWWSSMSCWPD